MARTGVIFFGINIITAESYTAWQIGITNDPDERKKEWGQTKDVSTWTQWEANSLSDAQAIESYFVNEKKMKGGTGGSTSADRTVYVYIFQIRSRAIGNSRRTKRDALTIARIVSKWFFYVVIGLAVAYLWVHLGVHHDDTLR